MNLVYICGFIFLLSVPVPVYLHNTRSYALVSEPWTSKRSTEQFPDLLNMKIRRDEGEPVSLSLVRTTGFNPDHIDIQLDEPVAPEARHVRLDSRSFKDMGFYQDKRHNAVVTISNKPSDGIMKRTMFGTLILDQKAYEIKPVSENEPGFEKLLESRNLQSHLGHMLHTLEHVELPLGHHDYVRSTERKADFETNEYLRDNERFSILLQDLERKASIERRRHKRRIDDSQTLFHVELTFLLEHSIYDFWIGQTEGNSVQALANIRFYYVHIFHGMFLAYRSIEDDEIQIVLWLKSIRIATTRQASSYAVLRSGRVDADQTLNGIASFMSKRNMNWANTDSLMIWTRRNLVDDLAGLAAGLCSVCEPGKSVSVNKDNGLIAYMTGAHELGHVLGAHHDDEDYGREDCAPSMMYLMYPESIQLEEPTFRNSFTFSPCSIYMFKRCFHGKRYTLFPFDNEQHVHFPRTCVFDAICEHGYPVTRLVDQALPGQRYSLDEQCVFGIFDEEAHWTEECQASRGPLEDVCKSMYCELGDRCFNRRNVELGAVAGSPCAMNATQEGVCWKGECVEEDSFVYAPEHGVDECETERVIPDDCRDTGTSTNCLNVVLNRPWQCFGTKKAACSRTCIEWGLYNVDSAPCEVTHGSEDTGTVPSPTTSESWKYELCGYDMELGWKIRCPGDPESCVPMMYFGDRVVDCPLDQADKNANFTKWVPSGVIDYVRCPEKLSRLIPEDWMCDNYTDCWPEESDQDPENCENVIPYCDAYEWWQLNCPNDPTKCVNISNLCDGTEDCGEGLEATDEDPYLCYLFKTRHGLSCPEKYTPCPDGFMEWYIGAYCLPTSKLCDGENDCKNWEIGPTGTDENQEYCDSLPPAICAEDEFYCQDRQFECMPTVLRCDGEADCEDGSDEANCDEERGREREHSHKLGIAHELKKLKVREMLELGKEEAIATLKGNNARKDYVRELATEIQGMLDGANARIEERSKGGKDGALSLPLLRVLSEEGLDKVDLDEHVDHDDYF